MLVAGSALASWDSAHLQYQSGLATHPLGFLFQSLPGLFSWGYRTQHIAADLCCTATASFTVVLFLMTPKHELGGNGEKAAKDFMMFAKQISLFFLLILFALNPLLFVICPFQ